MKTTGIVASTAGQVRMFLPYAKELQRAGQMVRWFLTEGIDNQAVHNYAIMGSGLGEKELDRHLHTEHLTQLFVDRRAAEDGFALDLICAFERRGVRVIVF